MSLSDRNAYLEEIYYQDQSLRKKLHILDDSDPEVRKIWTEISKVDSANLVSILAYLDRYGYPDTINYSANAQIAPWCVLQHTSNIEARVNNAHWLIDAANRGELKEGRLWLFLSRTYLLMHREQHEIDNLADEYTERNVVLMEALGLANDSK